MLDLDKHTIEFPCPKCGFYNPAFLRQVRFRDVIICRGCKCNIRLDDHMNEYDRARRRMQRSIEQLGNTLKGL